MPTKLQKTVDYGSYQVVTDYLAGFQYETKPVTQGGLGFAQLLFYPTPEGYVKALYKDANHPLAYQYVYNYTDHLGNIRLSYTWDTQNHQVKTLQENHYYPFGLRHQAYAPLIRTVRLRQSTEKEIRQIPPEAVVYKYKYNGKELQDELGLNVTAMDFRNYDPAIGRFVNQDWLAPYVPSFSPYRFAFDNPVFWADPLGLIERSVLLDMYNRSKNGETTWKNNEDLKGFTTDDGGFVGYTSSDTAMNQSPGETTNLPGVEVTYGNEQSYINAGKEIQRQVYNTRWYRDTGMAGDSKLSYIPPPKNLPGFPKARRVKPKGGRARWKFPNGDIGEWDSQHGEVERYNPRGKHKGVWDPEGNQKKGTIPGRKIDPIISHQTVNTVRNVATVAAIGYVLYTGVKWLIAVGGAPETGGASLLLIATP